MSVGQIQDSSRPKRHILGFFENLIVGPVRLEIRGNSRIFELF